jgi:hypothetical protein
MSASAVAWKSEGAHAASLHCGPLQGFAQCDSDGTSFVLTRWSGQTADSVEVLASAGPDNQSELKLAELYIRGTDLVADFVPAGPHRIAPQLCWRTGFEPRTAAIRIELMLSVRTELLDSAPSWSVLSLMKDSALFHAASLDNAAFEDISGNDRPIQRSDSAEHLFVFRHPRFGLSYAEMVHPSDFVTAEVAPAGQQPTSVRSKLFPERLEKGVIRRGRICGWFMPAQNDLETAVKLAKQFVEEPLPLTA